MVVAVDEKWEKFLSKLPSYQFRFWVSLDMRVIAKMFVGYTVQYWKHHQAIIYVVLFFIASFLSSEFSLAQENTRKGSESIQTNNSPKIVYFAVEMLPDSAWQKQLEGVVQKSRQTLGLDIEIVYMPLVRREMIEIIKNRIRSGPPFNIAVLANHQGEAPEAVKLFWDKGIKSFIVHEGMSELESVSHFGKPTNTQIYPTQILPDDELGGFDLLIYLIQSAREKKLRGSRLKLFALSGAKLDRASKLRISGLKRALVSNPDVELVHLVGARWNRQVAKFKIKGMLSRYGKPDIIWCANDDMALGAIDAFEELNLSLDNVYIGGFDWSPEALDRISKGEMTASMGGHQYDLFLAFSLAKMNSSVDERVEGSFRRKYKSRLTLLGYSDVLKFRNISFPDHYSDKDLRKIILLSGQSGFSLLLLRDSVEWGIPNE